MMPTVRISETYDLSTKIGKMGIVGIHTPTGSLIDRKYPGLILNYKKFRFVKCDVALACASMLPADPLQIGVSAGDIAPQDMFNPILYKAVSNGSVNNFLQWLQASAQSLTPGEGTDLNQGSVVDINDATFTSSNGEISQFDLYYALLSNSGGWRKAMPQAGLMMSGLRPLVFEMVSQYGMNSNPGYQSGDFLGGDDYTKMFTIGSGAPGAPTSDVNPSGSGVSRNTVIGNVNLRGRSMPMPPIDTVAFTQPAGTIIDARIVPQSSAPVNSNLGQVPPAYVGLIVLPPARLNQLYYRLKITWTVEFTGLRSYQEIQGWDYLSYTGQVAYGTDYATQSASFASLASMVDAQDADIEKVMEG
ncbi:capsid protein [Lynx rufus smacovirus 1]|uniref:capsid protein n=1 Tax=Lynx rufus smacovirus 1 TaxID=2592414 RepID=UPI002481DD6D|nr:capsid protein [Lynx rufus smacovirus 1]QDH43739.2 capsid protein [Lynx rufus smacovirus 1]